MFSLDIVKRENLDSAIKFIQNVYKITFPKNGDSSSIFDFWWKYVIDSYLDYFAGEFYNLKFNKEWDRIELEFFKNAYMNNEVYVYFDGTKFSIWQKENDSNSHKYINLINRENKMYFDENDLVVFKWGSNNSRYLQLLQYAFFEQNMIKRWYYQTVINTKEYQYNINSNDNNIVAEEIDNLINSELPIIAKNSLALEGDLPNELKPIQKTKTPNQSLLDEIIKFNKFIFDRLGYTNNPDFKKERLITSEAHNFNHNTNNFQLITLKKLRVFADDMKQKFGVDLEFQRTQDGLLNNQNYLIEGENHDN